jgi:hypothetical protein
LIRAGLPDSASRVAVRAHAEITPREDPVGELDLYEAMVRTALHQNDEAFRLLQSFYKTNPNIPPDEAGFWFEDLWGDPRWHALGVR